MTHSRLHPCAVAVYGTLKQGEENYRRFLVGKEPTFRGLVEIPYRMYENGEYPMLVPARDSGSIGVEVFEVDAEELRALDDLEVPYGYRRETVHLAPLGRAVELYVYPDPPPADFTLVATGVWSSGAGSRSGSGSDGG